MVYRRSRRHLAALVAVWLLALPHAAAAAPANTPTEIEVKAAFLYHFAQLVTWPGEAGAEPAAPIVIAVVGPDPFGDRLEETLGRETVRGRAFRIERVAKAADLSNPPDILFFAASDLGELERALSGITKSAVLTVGTAKGFAQHGGMIEFRLTPDSRVAFDINVRAVEAAGLRMSSQLLKIARIVEPLR